MTDADDRIRKKRRRDEPGMNFRELIGYVDEGPLPPRPSGKGGPSINQGVTPPPTSPINTTAPVASGTATVGSTLSCTTGAWTNSPTGYAYQWQRGGVNISGATASTYLTVTADGGTSVSCSVTATNASGSASAASNALAIAAAATSVWSAADAAANGMTLSNGGLTVTSPGTGGYRSIRGTVSQTSGKLYFEIKAVATASNDYIGLASAGFDATQVIGWAATPYSGGVGTNTLNRVSSGFTVNYTDAQYPNVGDTWALAVEFATGNIWVAVNNVWQHASNPATASLPVLSFVPATVGALFPTMTMQNANEVWTLQATAASQKYAPPAGFTPWG